MTTTPLRKTPTELENDAYTYCVRTEWKYRDSHALGWMQAAARNPHTTMVDMRAIDRGLERALNEK